MIPSLRPACLAAAALALAATTPANGQPANPAAAAALAALPNPSGKAYLGPAPETAAALFTNLLSAAPDSILALISDSAQTEPLPRFKARYLLNGLLTFTAPPDRATGRAAVFGAITSALREERPDDLRAFLIRELQATADPAAVPVIAPFLTHANLAETAAAALAAIGGPEAARAVRDALAKAPPGQRLLLIQTAGALRDPLAVPLLTPVLAESDNDLRGTAADALASIGAAPAAQPLLAAATAPGLSPAVQSRITGAALQLGFRLCETPPSPPLPTWRRWLARIFPDTPAAANRQAALSIFETLAASHSNAAGVHVLHAALRGIALADTGGAKAIAALAPLLASDDPRLANAAMEAGAAMAAPTAGSLWTDRTIGAPPALYIRILRLLGMRAEMASTPAILTGLRSTNAEIAAAAATAAAQIPGEQPVDALIAALAQDRDQVPAAARAALESSKSPHVEPRLQSAFTTADAVLKPKILGVISARRAIALRPLVAAAAADPEPAVRAAALAALGTVGTAADAPLLLDAALQETNAQDRAVSLQALAALGANSAARDPVAAAIATRIDHAPAGAKALLLKTLSSVPSPKAIAAVTSAIGNSDPAVQEAAVRALAAWPDPSALPELNRVATSATNELFHVLCVRAATRLAQDAPGMAPPRRVEACASLLAIARRPEEKRQVLSALAQISQKLPSDAIPAAIAAAQPALADSNLVEEAALAILEVASRSKDGPAPAVSNALEQVAALSRNPESVERAKSLAQRLHTRD